MQELDQASGVMMPFFDEDTKVLFIAGKGDGNIRYYELINEAPFCFPLSEFRTSRSQKVRLCVCLSACLFTLVCCHHSHVSPGSIPSLTTPPLHCVQGVAMLPKRACNPLKCEITRMLKLTNHNSVELLSFVVPRKSDAFQEDIFPDTRSGEPSMTATEWFDGKDSPPKTMSMDPAKNGGKTAAAAAFKPSSPKRTASGAGAGAGAGVGGSAVTAFEGKTAEQLYTELVAARKRIAELEAEVAALKA